MCGLNVSSSLLEISDYYSRLWCPEILLQFIPDDSFFPCFIPPLIYQYFLPPCLCPGSPNTRNWDKGLNEVVCLKKRSQGTGIQMEERRVKEEKEQPGGIIRLTTAMDDWLPLQPGFWREVSQLSCVRLFVTPWTVWRPARPLCPWKSPDKNAGVGSRSLLQGIFPTQGLSQDLPHCGQILYHLSH